MSTLPKRAEALAIDVSCPSDMLTVVLTDGRTVSVPVAWFPRLLEATAKQKADWELIGGGIGIYWEAIDQDISVASLLQPEHFVRLPDERLNRHARSGCAGRASGRARLRRRRCEEAGRRRESGGCQAEGKKSGDGQDL